MTVVCSCSLIPTIPLLVNGFPVWIHQFLQHLLDIFSWPQILLFIPIPVLFKLCPQGVLDAFKVSIRCSFSIMLQIWALGTLCLGLLFCVTGHTLCRIHFSGLPSSLSLFFVLFFCDSWSLFVFSESICVSWILCVFFPHASCFWLLSWLSLCHLCSFK